MDLYIFGQALPPPPPASRAAFVPAALTQIRANSVQSAAYGSSFATSPLSLARPAGASPRDGSMDGVGSLKAVAMAEGTSVLSGGAKEDKMGKYIESRGGSLSIRKVKSV